MMISWILVATSCFFFFSDVDGHGNMVWPITWIDAATQIGDNPSSRTLMKNGCWNKTKNRLMKKSEMVTKQNDCANLWYTNAIRPYPPAMANETVPLDMFDTRDRRQMLCKQRINNPDHWSQFCQTPWFRPGSALIFSPCGAAGGNINGCPEKPVSGQKYGTACNGVGYAFGKKAEEYQYPASYRTNWKRGSNQKVVWTVVANHLGGYAYRLAKMPNEGSIGLTEESFHKLPLDFVGKQFVRDAGTSKWIRNDNTKTTSSGTLPVGSQWRQNYYFGYESPKDSGQGTKGQMRDMIKVPKNIPPGKYVLSFRWDSAKTPQVWSICSNINIV